MGSVSQYESATSTKRIAWQAGSLSDHSLPVLVIFLSRVVRAHPQLPLKGTPHLMFITIHCFQHTHVVHQKNVKSVKSRNTNEAYSSRVQPERASCTT